MQNGEYRVGHYKTNARAEILISVLKAYESQYEMTQSLDAVEQSPLKEVAETLVGTGQLITLINALETELLGSKTP